MKYPTENDIKAIKAEEHLKLKQNGGHLPLIAGIVALAFLFFCVLPYFLPQARRGRPTPPPVAISLRDTAAPFPSTAATATATPTHLPTSTFPPTMTPVYGTPLPPPIPAVPAIPATLPPLPTHTAAPTYTPAPTWTPPATATDRPTLTPQATYTPLATQTPLATYTPLATWTPAPAAGTTENDSPLPDAVYWALASLACLLALAGVGIILLAARRTAVQPPAIIVQQAPARLPSPATPPLFLRHHSPPTPVTPPPAPVQSPPEVAPVTPAVTPPTNGHDPATITVSVAPAVPAEDEALRRELCAIWNTLEKPSFNEVIKKKWGENGKSTVRLAIVRRAIQWGREQGIIQPRRATA